MTSQLCYVLLYVGVEKVLEILRDELDRAMALSGICSIDKIRDSAVVLPRAAL